MLEKPKKTKKRKIERGERINYDNCYLCENMERISPESSHTQLHEAYFSADRQLSILYGMVFELCDKHHDTRSLFSPHRNRAIDLYLKKEAQKHFIRERDFEMFMSVFGKNYLTDAELELLNLETEAERRNNES